MCSSTSVKPNLSRTQTAKNSLLNVDIVKMYAFLLLYESTVIIDAHERVLQKHKKCSLEKFFMITLGKAALITRSAL